MVMHTRICDESENKQSQKNYQLLIGQEAIPLVACSTEGQSKIFLITLLLVRSEKILGCTVLVLNTENSVGASLTGRFLLLLIFKFVASHYENVKQFVSHK